MATFFNERFLDVRTWQAGLRMLPAASGLVITNDGTTPNTSIAVTADFVCLYNASTIAAANVADVGGTHLEAAVDVTINLTTTGANALDAGSIASNTWYFVWLIWGDGEAVSGLASTSATAPTMPSGFTHKVRVGAMRTDGSSVLYRTIQRGNRVQYKVTASTNTAALRQMASGSAGSPTTPTWVAVAVGAYVPTTATEVSATIQSSNLVAAAPNNAYGATTDYSTNPPPFSVNGGVVGSWHGTATFVLESANIYWANAGAAGAMCCLGWTDNVNAG